MPELECDECGEEFETEKGLEVHREEKHGEKNNEQIQLSLGIKQTALATLIIGLIAGFAAGAAFGQLGNLMPEDTSSSTTTPQQVVAGLAEEVGMNSDEVLSCIENSDGSEITEDKQKILQAAGRIGTPTFFIGNSETGYEKVSGAQPYPAMQPIIEEQLAEVGNGSDTIEDDELALESINLEGEPSQGQENATINVIEYSDYACPWCAEWNGFNAIPQRNIDGYESHSQLVDNYVDSGDVRLVFKDFPAHQNSMIAHKAANCVLEQNREKYRDFHDKLFEERDSWMS